MAPKNKFTKAEMVEAALRVVRARGIEGLTAKTMADELGTSTQPIFTGFGSMDGVRQEVYAAAVGVYDRYASAGLQEAPPSSASGCSTSGSHGRSPRCTVCCFAADTGEGPRRHAGYGTFAGAGSPHADRDLSHQRSGGRSVFPRPVAGGTQSGYADRDRRLPYSDQEIGQILTGFSVSICKSIKEIPGFAAGTFDRDATFRSLVSR